MKGFFSDVEPIQLAQTAGVQPQTIPVSTGNSGIAVVTPAHFIKEILHSDELEAKRKVANVVRPATAPHSL